MMEEKKKLFDELVEYGARLLHSNLQNYPNKINPIQYSYYLHTHHNSTHFSIIINGKELPILKYNISKNELRFYVHNNGRYYYNHAHDLRYELEYIYYELRVSIRLILVKYIKYPYLDR